MKSLLLLLAALSLQLTLVGQTLFEGTITYNIEYLKVPVEVEGMESVLPKEMSMKYSGSKVRVDQQLMGGSQSVVMDNETKSAFILMDMMGQRIAIPMSADEFEANNDQSADMEITYVDEHKTIMGYVCKKAIVNRAGAEEEMIVWYTKELNIENHQDFKDLDGFPMEYETHESNMLLRLTATKMNTDPIAPEQFVIPASFTQMSLDELNQMMGK